jgi:hypothetical protein
MVLKKPVQITGNSTPIRQPGNLPVIRSGAWHSLPPFGATNNATVPDGRLFALPFWPGRRCALLGIAVNVTLAAVGGNLRMGLYTSANGLPLSLVREFGSMGVGVIGISQFSGFSTHVEPDLYFLGICRQGGLLNLGLSTRDTWDPIISELTPVIGSNLNSYYIDGVAGAFPALFGPPDGSVQGPSAAVQLT